MSTARFHRPDGRDGTYGQWLAEVAAKWAGLPPADQDASRAAAKARLMAQIRAQDDGPTLMHIYDEIGWFGVCPADVVEALAAIKGDVEVHLNSPGGSVFDGVAIYNSLRQHAGSVGVVVDGLAASAASFIAMAASPGRLEMTPNGTVMIHEAWGLCVGDAAEMLEMAALLDKSSANIASIYAERSGRPAVAFRDLMKAETWATGHEAVDIGLADSVRKATDSEPAGAAAHASGVPWKVTITAGPGPRDAARHDPLKGSHSHAHPAYGTQGSDQMHSHDHSHNDDASHNHHATSSGDDEDGGQDHGHGHSHEPAEAILAWLRSSIRVKDRADRVLGTESMPLLDKAIPAHHTATVDESWDGPAAVAAMPAEYADLHYCHAWQSADADASPHKAGDDDADDKKGNYKFPHHETKGGPANLAACRNGLARLSGASIPDGDRAGVEAHLNAHLKDGGDDSEDHAGAAPEGHGRRKLSGAHLEQIRAALKGAKL